MTHLITPKATDSLETWLSYLEQSHFKPIDMGLERIKSVAQELDLLKPAPYVITVAGTNGKGSTCKMLETALLKAGKRVGVYSSPHLIRYNERVRVQGQMLADQAHIDSFAFIEQNRNQSLTYFEFSTLSALYLFKQAGLDVVILEVGLGGRLDATNIVDPDFAVITSIDIDHVEFLGDNREDIGREKAGIFRPNIPVVIGEPDCPNSILERADSLNCHVFRRNVDWIFEQKSDRLYWQSSSKNLVNLPLPQIPLPNAATALAVLTNLPFEISDEILHESLSQAQLAGRFQTLGPQDFVNFAQKTPLARVIIDVGHNPHAARYLASRLAELKAAGQKIYAVFSVLKDKDLSGIVEPLAQIIDEWHCVGLDNYRGQSGEEVLTKLKIELPQAKAQRYPNIATATQHLFEQAGSNDIVLVFGSFYTVADFLLFLEA
ncbi:bifunctional folylpolyglutamate synthase/dihydrofolate synthase [Pasteurellaceae bacterium RH1A]|nr:bifunctional folylpolyglutamate synthase/dihydrofolate synthase [Pasteurellaceae bacterium RH1A]